MSRIQVRDGFLVLMAALWCADESGVLPIFLLAAAVHECGHLFVIRLSGGTVQAFNAATLESLWIYTDKLGGQPNCPITYKDGYIYAGFWNSEDRNAIVAS